MFIISEFTTYNNNVIRLKTIQKAFIRSCNNALSSKPSLKAALQRQTNM